MGIYGQCTGTLATGLLLIKVLDPDGDTMTSESISGSSTWDPSTSCPIPPWAHAVPEQSHALYRGCFRCPGGIYSGRDTLL